MKQYTWIPWKKAPEIPVAPISNTTEEPNDNTETTRKDPQIMKKAELVKTMEYEHPLVTLKVGTGSVNVEESLSENSKVNTQDYDQVVGCLKDIVSKASDIKRACQQLIGRFIERITSDGDILQADRDLMDSICPCISTKSTKGKTNNRNSRKNTFPTSLMNYLYTGNYPTNKMVAKFVCRAQDMGLLDKGRGKGDIRQRNGYPCENLLRSAVSQLSVEIKKIYRNGTLELHEKLLRQKDKGLLPNGCDIKIQPNKSVIENFVTLNKISKSGRRTAPISTMQRSFYTFSEVDLLHLFWKSGNEYLRKRLLELDNERKPEDKIPACVDLQSILSVLPSGSFITKLLSPVGRPIDKKNRHGPRGYKDNTVMMSIKDMRGHLGNIRKEGVTVSSIQETPRKNLPKRFTSTAGGLDYYLTEIRNVVKTKEDVEAIWGCGPKDIKILGLDLGQAYVVGASALLPNTKKSRKNGPAIFHNLVVKQKAAYQPTFKFRRWSEDKKRAIVPGTAKSISDIENSLPPLRGEGASIENHVKELEN
ncbi:hypothetical protein BGZ79_000742, partial [Entomortierella chlamydospora]